MRDKLLRSGVDKTGVGGWARVKERNNLRRVCVCERARERKRMRVREEGRGCVCVFFGHEFTICCFGDKERDSERDAERDAEREGGEGANEREMKRKCVCVLVKANVGVMALASESLPRECECAGESTHIGVSG